MIIVVNIIAVVKKKTQNSLESVKTKVHSLLLTKNIFDQTNGSFDDVTLPYLSDQKINIFTKYSE